MLSRRARFRALRLALATCVAWSWQAHAEPPGPPAAAAVPWSTGRDEGAVATLPFAPGFRALIEGRFSDAAELFGAIEAPLDPVDAKASIAVELRRIAQELHLRGVTLVPASSPLLRSRKVTASRPAGARDFDVPPYDHALDQLTSSELEGAEQTLRLTLASARDPVELAVTRVLYATTTTWMKNNVVPVAIPASKAEGIVPINERGSWYGWQVSLIDVTSIATMTVIGAFNQDIDNGVIRGFAVGAALVTIAAPSMVHIAHGRSKAGVYSLASRSLLPITGGLVGALVTTPVALVTSTTSTTSSSNTSAGQYLPLGGALVGAAIGLIGAMAFDSAALSFEPRETPAPTSIPRPTRAHMKPRAPAMVPFMTGTLGGFAVGVGGTL